MEQLLISPKILRVLAVFLETNQSFYVREIARKLTLPPATSSRILNRLVRQELLTSQKKGSLKLFQLNLHHPLFPEIKSLVKKLKTYYS